METDNKYDNSFRKAEIEEQKDNFEYEEKIEREHEQNEKDRNEYFTREPENFGGQHYL